MATTLRRPSKRRCPECGREVWTLPIAPRRAGVQLALQRWVVGPHRPRFKGEGFICRGAGALVRGIRRRRAAMAQLGLFAEEEQAP
jgi:hypothetical protein